MGEVYRATDTKLGRDVALKVLPAEVAQDPERLARFRREAQVLASLNHPNIAAIHGLEEADSQLFLVLELVDGEDLAARLKRGPLPVEEALPVARQIAEGLEEAHEKGIVHRDLKPANVKLTPGGKVKVLDFGLARAYAGDPASGSSANLSQSPTLAHTGTQAGVILGTAAYMSPEQARGKAVDKRADIWAFGAVLHEMLTGHPLFTGETVSDVLAAVLTREPDWAAVPASTPAGVRRLLRRCLERDPRRRLRDIGEARLALTEGEPEPEAGGALRGGRLSAIFPWAVAAFAILVAAAWTLLGGRPVATDQAAARFAITAPAGTRLHAVVISPDGRRLVYVAESGTGDRQLFLRELVSADLRLVPGTQRAEEPFWSPDSQAVGFFADEKLKTAHLGSGALEALCDAPTPRGGAWGRDGHIVFARTAIWRVMAAGGAAEPLTRLDPALGENQHRYPNLLPDQDHVLYFSRNSARPEQAGVWLWSLRTGERKQLVQAPSSGVYAEPGFLLYRRGSRLVAQRLDLGRLELVGEPATVTDDLWFDPSISARMNVSVSRAGTLVFRTGGMERSELVWLGRDGSLLGRLGEPGSFTSVDLSSDAKRALFTRGDPETEQRHLWVNDLTTKTDSQLTFEGDAGFGAAFSPDGSRVAVSTLHGAGIGVEEVTLGGGTRTVIDGKSSESIVSDWTPDGRQLVLTRSARGVGVDSRPNVVLHDLKTGQEAAAGPERGKSILGAVSPDGRWLAYASDITGEYEVYVARMDNKAQFQRISTSGGQQPRWDPEGRELFFLSPDWNLMAVPILKRDSTFEWSPPRALFLANVHDLGSRGLGTSYDVAPGGQRFLVSRRLPQGPAPAAVIVRWPSLLRGLGR
jgi:Tol biopolymer transport system component